MRTIPQEYRITPIDEVALHPRNPRRGDLGTITESVDANGFYGAVLVQRSTGLIIAGNHRYKAARALGAREIPAFWIDVSDAEAMRIMAVDNRASDLATNDPAALATLLRELAEEEGPGLRGTGYDDEYLDGLLKNLAEGPGGSAGGGGGGEGTGGARGPKLVEMFLVPPFSVLDARQGYWQDRKRAWLALGIESERGRGEDMLNLQRAVDLQNGTRRGDMSNAVASGTAGGMANALAGKSKAARLTWVKGNRDPATLDEASRKIAAASLSGTSVFDPVICELAYRWFCPPGGLVVDPFAGGSVRGIVASKLGRRYAGVELREEQVLANREQAARICRPSPPEPGINDPDGPLTPIEVVGNGWVKREDTLDVGGARGGLARTLHALADGAPGLVAYGLRGARHYHPLALVARRLGIPLRIHTASGELEAGMQAALAAGAELEAHKAAGPAKLARVAAADAAARGWRVIGPELAGPAAVAHVRRQAANIPHDAKRVLMVADAVTIVGVMLGLRDGGRAATKIVAVLVGDAPADVVRTLDHLAPDPGWWHEQVELVPSPPEPATTTRHGAVELDPRAEAKCLPHLREGDCLWLTATAPALAEAAAVPRWVVGDSRDITQHLAGEAADFVFTCPPYADLEVYSDDPRDISTLSYEAFIQAFRTIVAGAISLLKPDRFAMVVVGDVRAPDGTYRGFPADTIAAFEDAGAILYNEAILVTAVGSLPVRAGRVFASSRKLGKTHQNVLVFVKGDPRRATEACGPVEVADVPEEGEMAEPISAHLNGIVPE